MELYSLMMEAGFLFKPTPCNVLSVPKGSGLRYSTHSEPDFPSLPAVQTVNFPFRELPLLVMDWVLSK